MDEFYIKKKDDNSEHVKKNEIANFYPGKTPFDVIMKLRPMLFHEKQISTQETIKVLDRESLILKEEHDNIIDITTLTLKKLHRFTHVFDLFSSNSKMFRIAFECHFPEMLKGQNFSFITYGGADSGKTHTMIGNVQDPGILILFFYEYFNFLEDNNMRESVVTEIGCMEYSDEVFTDLLTGSAFELPIRTDSFKNFHLVGLSHYKVNFLVDALKILNYYPNSKRKDKVIMSKVIFIDFGAIEFAKSSKHESILKSLIAFSNCLRNLSEICVETRKDHYVPYKSSTLTHYLSNVLGGKSKTVLICTLSPCIQSLDYTVTTLRHANQAKIIKGHSKYNVFSITSMLAFYHQTKEQIKKYLHLSSDNCTSNLSEENLDTIENIKQIVYDFRRYFLSILEIENEINIKENEYLNLYKPFIVNQVSLIGQILKSNDVKQFFLCRLNATTKKELLKNTVENQEIFSEQIISLKKLYRQFFRLLDKIKIIKKSLIEGNIYHIKGNQLAFLADIAKTLKYFQRYSEFLLKENQFTTNDIIVHIKQIFDAFEILDYSKSPSNFRLKSTNLLKNHKKNNILLSVISTSKEENSTQIHQEKPSNLAFISLKNTKIDVPKEIYENRQSNMVYAYNKKLAGFGTTDYNIVNLIHEELREENFEDQLLENVFINSKSKNTTINKSIKKTASLTVLNRDEKNNFYEKKKEKCYEEPSSIYSQIKANSYNQKLPFIGLKPKQLMLQKNNLISFLNFKHKKGIHLNKFVYENK